jgi:hypothetical protein
MTELGTYLVIGVPAAIGLGALISLEGLAEYKNKMKDYNKEAENPEMSIDPMSKKPTYWGCVVEVLKNHI